MLIAVALLAPLCHITTPARAEETAPDLEYKVKAAYMYNFIRFIDWPTDRLDNKDTPIQLCVLGADPFGPHLDPIVERTALGHGLQLQHYPTFTQDIAACHILFINEPEPTKLVKILDQITWLGTMTVGDSHDFAKLGGIIGFVIQDGKVRLEINQQVALKKGFRISAKLLELARIVD